MHRHARVSLNVLISVHQCWWWLSLKFHDKWQLTFISFSDSASIFHAYLSLCLVICISNTLFFISSNYFLQIWTNLLIFLSKCLRKLLKLNKFWLSPPKFRCLHLKSLIKFFISKLILGHLNLGGRCLQILSKSSKILQGHLNLGGVVWTSAKLPKFRWGAWYLSKFG